MVGVPLAWLQISKNKGRTLAAAAGIAFASLLMLTHMGVSEALFQSSVLVHGKLNGEILLSSKQYQILVRPLSFSDRRLHQALAVDGVESVAPIYLGLAPWTNPSTRETRDIFMVGFDPRPGVLNVPEVNQHLNELRQPNTMLFDELSRPEFGAVDDAFLAGEAVEIQVGPRKMRVVGLFELGTSFGIDGTLIMSDLNFLRLSPTAREGLISLGVVKLSSEANVEAVRAELERVLPADIRVLSRDTLMEQEVDYWATGTPIGFSTMLGVVMGWIVGAVIVYQILYSDVSEHLAEYATLKAMGYSNRYLLGVVMQEAVILSALGFLPSLVLVEIVYAITYAKTLLPIAMTLERATTVYGYTLTMCAVSGLLAARRIRSADPASIF